LTAKVSEGLRDRYVEAGITDYLAKPIKPEKLFELIEQVLKRGSTGGASGLSVATVVSTSRCPLLLASEMSGLQHKVPLPASH
jgi:DNA-binding response OmpR family regulator